MDEKKKIISKIKKAKLSKAKKDKLLAMTKNLSEDELNLIIEMQTKTPEELEQLAQKQVEEAKQMHEQIKSNRKASLAKSQQMLTQRIIEVKKQDKSKDTKAEIEKLRKELE